MNLNLFSLKFCSKSSLNLVQLNDTNITEMLGVGFTWRITKTVNSTLTRMPNLLLCMGKEAHRVFSQTQGTSMHF